jgi:hypothetical protein
MRGKRRVQSLTVLAVALSVTFVPVFVNLIVANGALGWEGTTWTLSAVAGAAALLVTVFGYREVGAVPSFGEEREQAAIQLIEAMASIEQLTLNVFRGLQQNTARESRRLSLRRIRDAMVELGAWTEEDAIGFDIALRARNAIVHGDLQEVDMVDLKYAIEKTKQLLGKIKELEDE